METLEIAYKILYSLEHKDKPKYMGQIVSPEVLNISDKKWLEVVQTLLDEGYIAGITIKKNILGDIKVDIEKARITLSGAQYLKENSAMKKFARVATDIITIGKDII